VLDTSKGIPISLADAKAKGVPVIAYGQFINDVLNFLIVAFVIFLIIKQYNRLKTDPAPTTKQCPDCYSTIDIRAVRCPQCTVVLKAT
jgi:large conductance mechanosensitive channel